MRPLSLSEYSLAAWILTLYAFGANSELVWISNAAAALTSGAALLQIIRSNSLTLNPVLVSRFAFVFYCGLTLLAGSPTAVSLLTVAEIVVVMTAAANIAWASRSIRSVEFGCYGGALVLLVNSYLETGMTGSATRYGNLLGNANSYAFALMMASLFAIRRLLFAGKRSKPLAARTMLILLVLLSAQQIVVATGSRKGILSLIVVSAFAIGGTWLLRGPVQALRFTIPILLVVAIVFALATATPHASRMQSIVEWISGADVRESSATVRASMAAEAWELWRQKPLFGWGFDQYRFVSSRGDYSHSNLLELMVNGGIAAVTLYYAAFGFVAIDIRRQWRRTRFREQRLDLAWAALIAFLLFTWSLAAVQYEQKLDTVVLAAVSIIPGILAQTAAGGGDHVLRPWVEEDAVFAGGPNV
jgi:O-antigen ligase